MEPIGKKLNAFLKIEIAIGILLFLLLTQFGPISFVWSLLGSCLFIFLYINIRSKLSTNEETDRFLIVSVLLAASVFVGLSPIMLETLSLFESLVYVFTIPFVFLGMSAIKRQNKIASEWLLKIIYVSIGLTVFLSLAATILQYGPFYRLLYEGKVLYFEGEQYRVASEMLIWNGLGWVTATPSWMYGYLAVLIAPLVLLDVKNWKHFFQKGWQRYAVILALVTMGLLTDLTVLFYAFLVYILRFLLQNQPWKKLPLSFQKGIGISLILIVSGGIFLGFADAYGWFGLDAFIRSISLLNRVYNLAFIDRYQVLLVAIPQSLFGQYGNLIFQNQFLYETGSLWFDFGYQGGLFSFLSFGLLIVFSINMLTKTPKQEKSPSFHIMSMILLLIHLVWFFHYPLFPYIRETQEWIPQVGITHPLFLLSAMLLGYLAQDPLKGWVQSTPTGHSGKVPRKEKRPSLKRDQWKVLD